MDNAKEASNPHARKVDPTVIFLTRLSQLARCAILHDVAPADVSMPAVIIYFFT